MNSEGDTPCSFLNEVEKQEGDNFICAFAVMHIGCMNNNGKQQAHCIGNDMPLSAFDLFTSANTPVNHYIRIILQS